MDSREEAVRQEASDRLGQELSDAVWRDMYDRAQKKLRHIVTLFGDADGARNTVDYIAQLTIEAIREDALRRLAQLAFGRANDAVRLALNPREVDPGELDLSAVAELKVTDKGGVEVKLVDRVRALETLCGLLGESGNGGAEELYRALEDAAGQLEEGYGG